MLSLKPGVRFENISDSIVDQLPTICRVYRSFGQTCTITSARDGTHMAGSKHYTGEAIDLRTRDFSLPERREVHQTLQIVLGSDFDVVLEKDHIHLEFDPP